jgi:hypothetical protein
MRCGTQTLSTILMACEVAAQSDDVPPLQSYVDSIFAFRERNSPGEITRRIHLEEWHRYMRIRNEERDDTQPQMDDMFAKMRNEIGGMERRSKEFKSMVDELIRMVAGMQEIVRLRQGARGGAGVGGGGGRLQIRPDGFVNVNGFWIRSATRVPPYAAHRRDAAGARARAMTRSPSDLLPTPILANSRARLPPLTGIHPPPPPPSPLPTAGSISSVSRSRRQQRAVASSSSSAVNSRTIIHQIPSSPSRSRSRSPPPPPPPLRTARNIHRRLFQRVFHMSQNSNVHPRHRTRTRTPSPAARAPSPLGTPPTPPPTPQPQSSGTEFSSYESPSASLITETRTRLPPPPDSSPIPYRPPGQRLFSFLHRL